MQVRVATYNILRGGQRGAALDEAVRALRADVLLVNEAPKTPWLWRRTVTQQLNRWSRRHVVGGRNAGSNLVAVGPQVQALAAGAEVIRQPWFRPRRGVAWAQLCVRGLDLGVVSCHLSLDRASRRNEVARVLDVAGRLSGVVVVGGDLNEPPGGPSWGALARAGFRDHGSDAWATFPAESPRVRIDALLVRGPAGIVHHGDPGVPRELLSRASDHLPVVIDLVPAWN